MTTTKTKRIKATGLTNRIDFECTVDRCTFIQTELRQIAAARAAREVIAKSYCVEEEAALKAELKAKAVLCEKFAEEHRPELLPNEKRSKSAETPLSRYGFRTGTPALKPLRKLSWEKIVENIQKLKLTQFLRSTFEVDKQALLTAQTDAPLSEIGVRVSQEETFFIEPKVDGAETLKAEVV